MSHHGYTATCWFSTCQKSLEGIWLLHICAGSVSARPALANTMPGCPSVKQAILHHSPPAAERYVSSAPQLQARQSFHNFCRRQLDPEEPASPSTLGARLGSCPPDGVWVVWATTSAREKVYPASPRRGGGRHCESKRAARTGAEGWQLGGRSCESIYKSWRSSIGAAGESWPGRWAAEHWIY